MGRSRSRSRSKVISRSRSRSRSTTPPPPPPPTPTSSIDSSSDPLSSSALPLHPRNDHDVSRSTHPDTDLRLSLGGVSRNICVPLVGERHREKRHDWPPIKPLLRCTLVGRFSSDGGQGPCLFVKVYMEGVLIGRKLDLLAHHDYDDLVTTLSWMFKTEIHSPGKCTVDSGPETIYILTYEDKDGDWMMVGDVPWEMFKRSVKRLMITRADKC